MKMVIRKSVWTYLITCLLVIGQCYIVTARHIRLSHHRDSSKRSALKYALQGRNHAVSFLEKRHFGNKAGSFKIDDGGVIGAGIYHINSEGDINIDLRLHIEPSNALCPVEPCKIVPQPTPASTRATTSAPTTMATNAASSTVPISPTASTVSKVSGPITPKVTGPTVFKPSGPISPKSTGMTAAKISGPTNPKVTGPTVFKPSGPTTPKSTGPTVSKISGPTTPKVTGPTVFKPSGPTTPKSTGPTVSKISGSTLRTIGSTTPKATEPSTAKPSFPATNPAEGGASSSSTPGKSVTPSSNIASGQSVADNVLKASKLFDGHPFKISGKGQAEMTSQWTEKIHKLMKSRQEGYRGSHSPERNNFEHSIELPEEVQEKNRFALNAASHKDPTKEDNRLESVHAKPGNAKFHATIDNKVPAHSPILKNTLSSVQPPELNRLKEALSDAASNWVFNLKNGGRGYHNTGGQQNPYIQHNVVPVLGWDWRRLQQQYPQWKLSRRG